MPWRSKSLCHLADELAEQGHGVSAPTVAGLLREESFSLQGNAKTIEGGRHPDRDPQFAHTNAAVEEYLAAGQPLTSHEVIVNLIAGTTTRTGLTVTARLDDTIYPKSIKITDREMADLETQHLTKHGFHGDWNYTVSPADQP
nr:hypothetical protein [Cryobacterium sp. M15]